MVVGEQGGGEQGERVGEMQWLNGNPDIEPGAGAEERAVGGLAPPAPPPALVHLEQVCVEMISFLFLIYALKTWGQLDVFRGGPLTLLYTGGRKGRGGWSLE